MIFKDQYSEIFIQKYSNIRIIFGFENCHESNTNINIRRKIFEYSNICSYTDSLHIFFLRWSIFGYYSQCFTPFLVSFFTQFPRYHFISNMSFLNFNFTITFHKKHKKHWFTDWFIPCLLYLNCINVILKNEYVDIYYSLLMLSSSLSLLTLFLWERADTIITLYDTTPSPQTF